MAVQIDEHVYTECTAKHGPSKVCTSLDKNTQFWSKNCQKQRCPYFLKFNETLLFDNFQWLDHERPWFFARCANLAFLFNSIKIKQLNIKSINSKPNWLWHHSKQGLSQDSEAAKVLGPLEACLKISWSILKSYLNPTWNQLEAHLKPTWSLHEAYLKPKWSLVGAYLKPT
jgi:hypothetical protein